MAKRLIPADFGKQVPTKSLAMAVTACNYRET